MKLEHSILGELEASRGFVDQSEGVPVTTHLLFVPVARGRFPEYDRAHSRRLDLYALDPVRRDRALDHRVLPERLEPLRCLMREELLSTLCLGEVGEIPGRRHRQLGEA